MAGARARSIACATVHTWGHQTICSKLHVNSAGWPPRVACGGVRVGWERDTPLTRPQEPLATRNVPILECTDFIGILTKRAILDKSSGNPMMDGLVPDAVGSATIASGRPGSPPISRTAAHAVKGRRDGETC